MKHQWKTGRDYDEHGQRMVAEVDTGDCCIRFSDLSRHINGAVPLCDSTLGLDLTKYAIESLVMTNYDFSNYAYSSTTLDWE
jgi:hypothetical protein